jgi:hypothetical protein
MGRTGEWNGWYIKPAEIRFGSLRFESPDELSVYVTFPMHHDTQNGGTLLIAAFRLKMPIRPDHSSREPEPGGWVHSRLAAIEGAIGLPISQRLALAPFTCVRGSFFSDVEVCLDEVANNQLSGFALAERGFPSSLSDNYSRMLYLSAITITTLGYGDILPLTPRARTAVATEAVIGVVLIGLFLNSLAREGKTEPERKRAA